MADPHGLTIDRLLAREVPAEEQRQLAQSALEEPDLLDTLTATAVVQSVLSKQSTTGAELRALPTRPLQPRRRLWTLAGAALAAAATIVTALVYLRSQPAGSSVPSGGVVVEAPVATAPVLLMARAEATPTSTFRSDQTASRLSKQNGAVTTVRDGVVEIDLGALDGLSEGLRVDVLSANGSERSQLTITTVFRERARGRLPGAVTNVSVGDRVEIGAPVHVKALLDQAATRQSAQDAASVQKILELAAAVAESPDVPADLRRQARRQLGGLKHGSGELDAAEHFLALASGDFDMPPVASSPERADVLNELGVVQIERRAYAAADRTLRSADAYSAGVTKMRILNNLGAIAALGGNRAAARSFYESARELAADSPELTADRAAIEKNLNALQNHP